MSETKPAALSHQINGRARRDAGFSMAALVIFLTAVSILLTISVPSYVMQAKREQEKELIFRGEEYTRAIQKFQRTLNLLPTSVDELLSSNGTRFLRKAYADPVSGEPWRVIILNSDGTLTGSNLYPTMGAVPTTTSVRNTAPQQPAQQQRPGQLQIQQPGQLQQQPGQLQQQPGQVLQQPGQLQQQPGQVLQQPGQVQRPAQVQQQQPVQQQPQQQATPLTGIVGVGSASKGTAVMVYDKQELYSNWEFIAQLQQRGGPQQQQPGQQQQQQRGPQPPAQQQQQQPGPRR